VVSELHKKQKKNPPQITSKPYYRANLDTTKNDNTGFSQHELLYKLSQNNGAMVYYACPMLFDKSVLYEVNVSLESLRLVDFSSCPSDFSDNSKHYIYFDQMQGDPIWCSEPVLGEAITAKEFASLVVTRLRQGSSEEMAAQVMGLLNTIKNEFTKHLEQKPYQEPPGDGLELFANALTIVRFDEVVN
jgi:hypothetical protein